MALVLVIKIVLQSERFPMENLDSSDIGDNKNEKAIRAELSVVNLDGFVEFG